jgi:hypothetical protein
MGVPSKRASNSAFLDKQLSKIIICTLMMIAIIQPLPLYGRDDLSVAHQGPSNLSWQGGVASPIPPAPVGPSPAALAYHCRNKSAPNSYLSTESLEKIRNCHRVPCISSLVRGDPRANCRLPVLGQQQPNPDRMLLCQAAFSMCFTNPWGAPAVFDAMKKDCGKYRGENLVLCKIGYLAGLMASLDFSKVNGQNHCLNMPAVISWIERWQCPKWP